VQNEYVFVILPFCIVHDYSIKLVTNNELGCWCLQSWSGARQCSSMRRRSPWQLCKRPPPGTVTLNNSVEYLPTHYLLYLAPTSRGREGWEKPKHKLAHKQQAVVITLCEELQASNCIYKSRGAPARGTPSIPGENCGPALLRG